MKPASPITMIPVESSQFAAVGHAPELNVLAIQFHPKKSGAVDVYHYENVDAAMFAELLAAVSQGSYFIQNIKKHADKFPYAKVEQAPAAAATEPGAPA